MARTRVKICGITRIDDALAAAEYGADAVGLVHVDGAARRVADAVACEIIDALPAFVTPVLLFANQSPQFITAAARGLGVSTVQLHGDEELVLASDLVPLRVIKAIRTDPERVRMELTQWTRLRPSNLGGIVLETAGREGGSGVANDWALVRELLDEHYLDPVKGPPVIVAGGLTPESVGAVVRLIRPYAVDVSSGVEDGVKGVKSRTRMSEFIAAVREAE